MNNNYKIRIFKTTYGDSSEKFTATVEFREKRWLWDSVEKFTVSSCLSNEGSYRYCFSSGDDIRWGHQFDKHSDAYNEAKALAESHIRMKQRLKIVEFKEIT